MQSEIASTILSNLRNLKKVDFNLYIKNNSITYNNCHVVIVNTQKLGCSQCTLKILIKNWLVDTQSLCCDDIRKWFTSLGIQLISKSLKFSHLEFVSYIRRRTKKINDVFDIFTSGIITHQAVARISKNDYAHAQKVWDSTYER